MYRLVTLLQIRFHFILFVKEIIPSKLYFLKGDIVNHGQLNLIINLKICHFWIRQYPYQSQLFCVIDILGHNFH